MFCLVLDHRQLFYLKNYTQTVISISATVFLFLNVRNFCFTSTCLGSFVLTDKYIFENIHWIRVCPVLCKTFTKSVSQDSSNRLYLLYSLVEILGFFRFCFDNSVVKNIITSRLLLGTASRPLTSCLYLLSRSFLLRSSFVFSHYKEWCQSKVSNPISFKSCPASPAWPILTDLFTKDFTWEYSFWHPFIYISKQG